MSNFDTSNKIKFAMGSSQTFTIANWEQTQFGMKYNTADGRFFDASKGLTDLLQEMNLAMNTQVTIEKRPNPNTKPGQQDYGRFYVNNLCLDDLRNGVSQQQVQPQHQGTSQTPPATVPPTTTQPVGVPPTTAGNAPHQPATSDIESRLTQIEARLVALESNKGDLPF